MHADPVLGLTPMLQARFLRQIRPSDIQICLREDGTEWLLGSGSFGEVRRAVRKAFSIMAMKCCLFVLILHPHAHGPPMFGRRSPLRLPLDGRAFNA